MYSFAKVGAVCAVTLSMMAVIPQGLPAAIVRVPVNYDTVQNAVKASKSGDEIILGSGLYLEMVLVDGKSLTFRAQDPSNPPNVISFRIINAPGTVTFENLQLGGLGPGYPTHSILAEKSSIALRNLTIFGGGVRTMYGGSLLMEGCHVIKRPQVEGLHAEGVQTVTIRNSLIEGGPGYEGSCSGSLMAQPQNGFSAVMARQCGTVTMTDTIVRGGDGGALTDGLNCEAELPIIAQGGHGIVLDAVSSATTRNVDSEGGSGSPEGNEILLLNGTKYSDETMAGLIFF